METKQFTTDNNLIYHLIDSQKTNFTSAINELIQNSYDADATECRIFIDENSGKFSISDNGKGFKDILEIESYFGTFGTIHSEDNSKKFGRFRLGRSQIFSLAKTTWISNNFKLTVDIKNKGLNYDVEELSIFSEGCTINGEFYKEKKASVWLSSIYDELGKKYFFLRKMKIFINDKLFNDTDQLFDNEYKEFEDFYFFPDFYYSSFYHETKTGLDIYNLGIFTKNYKGFAKLRGSIVTKKHLPLDISRTEILNEEGWKKIELTLKEISYSKKTYSWRNTAPEDFFHSFMLNNIDDDDFVSAKFFTEIQRGRSYSIRDLVHLNKKIAFVFYDMQSEERKYLIDNFKRRQKNNYVLIDALPIARGVSRFKNLESITLSYTMKMFGDEIISHFKNKDQNSITLLQDFINRWEDIESIIDCSGDFDDYILKEDELTLQEKIILETLNDNNILISGNNDLRKIFLGISSTKNAWTDGLSFIVINKNEFKNFNKSKAKLYRIALLLVHEYTHVDNKCVFHDLSFFESFHDSLLDYDKNVKLHLFIDKFFIAYNKKLLDNNLKVPSSINDNLTVVNNKKLIEEKDKLISISNYYMSVVWRVSPFITFLTGCFTDNLLKKEDVKKALMTYNDRSRNSFSSQIDLLFGLGNVDLKKYCGIYSTDANGNPIAEIVEKNGGIELKINNIFDASGGQLIPLKPVEFTSAIESIMKFESYEKEISNRYEFQSRKNDYLIFSGSIVYQRTKYDATIILSNKSNLHTYKRNLQGNSKSKYQKTVTVSYKPSDVVIDLYTSDIHQQDGFNQIIINELEPEISVLQSRNSKYQIVHYHKRPLFKCK